MAKRIPGVCALLLFLAMHVVLAGAASACPSYAWLDLRIWEGRGGWEMDLLKGTGGRDFRGNDRGHVLATLDLDPYVAGGSVTAPFRLDYSSVDGKVTVTFGPNSFSVISGLAGLGFASFSESAKASAPSWIDFSSVLLNGTAIPGVTAKPGSGKAAESYRLEDTPVTGDLSLSGILSLASLANDGGRHIERHGGKHSYSDGDRHFDRRGGKRTEFDLVLSDGVALPPPEVPLPPSILLFGSGVAGLAIARKFPGRVRVRGEGYFCRG
jgi:hypothetical protein